MGLFPMNVGGGGTSFLQAGEYLYLHSSSTVINTVQKGNFTKGSAAQFSLSLYGEVIFNVTGCSTYSIVRNSDAQYQSGVFFDGNLNNLGIVIPGSGSIPSGAVYLFYIATGATTTFTLS